MIRYVLKTDKAYVTSIPYYQAGYSKDIHSAKLFENKREAWYACEALGNPKDMTIQKVTVTVKEV